MSKEISISEELYKELLQIKNELREERTCLTDRGYKTKEINERIPPATLEGAIRKIMWDKAELKESNEIYKEAVKHCIDCCDCDDCVEDRHERARVEAEQASW